MGLFTSSYREEFVPAKVPYKIRTYLDNGDIYEKVYDEDYEGFFAHTAKTEADEAAISTRIRGVQIHDTHYPAHRINKVEVVKCEWAVVEAKP